MVALVPLGLCAGALRSFRRRLGGVAPLCFHFLPFEGSKGADRALCSSFIGFNATVMGEGKGHREASARFLCKRL